MIPPRLRTPLALAAAATAGALACSSSSSGPDDDEAFATCSNVSFAATTGEPLDQIAIGSLPGDFEPPFAAEVLADDGTVVGYAMVPVDAGSGDASLIVPFAPDDMLGGGAVDLVVTDGTRRCAPVTFTVEALPAADGELQSIADVLESTFAAQATLMGTTPAELQATDATDLPPMYYPLKVVQNALSDPTNEYSLASVLDGSSPWSDPVAMAFAERLMAKIGVLDGLEAGPALASGPPPAGITDPPEECSPEGIGEDAQRLDECMDLAWSVTLSLSGLGDQVLDDMAEAFGVAGLVPNPGGQVAAALVTVAIFVIQQQRNRLAGLLPSTLTGMTVSFGQTEFLEDEPGPGAWDFADVYATNDGWKMGAELLQGLLAASPILSAAKFEAGATLPIDAALFALSQYVLPGVFGEDEIEIFEVEPIPFGPVEVTSEDWSEFTVAQGTAIERTAHQTYALREVGSATISVRTMTGEFAGQQMAEQTEVTIRQLDIDVDPAEVIVVPGEIVFFDVVVTDAQHPEAVALVEGQTWQGDAELTYEGENHHTIEYTAPASLGDATPDVIYVHHTSTEGARNGGPPRTAHATVRFGGLRITTNPGCVELGGEPFGIDLEILGGLGDVELVWTPSAGSIDPETATYTLPTQSQFVTIRVELADQPLIYDEVEFQVGGCSCTGSVTVGGSTTALEHLSFAISDDGSGVTKVNYFGSGPSGGGLSFGPEFLPQTLPFGTTGPVEARGQGSVTGTVWMNLPGIGDLDLPPFTVDIEENTASRLVGSVVGQVEVPQDGGSVAMTLSFTFSIEADPVFSDETMGFCEVAQAGP